MSKSSIPFRILCGLLLFLLLAAMIIYCIFPVTYSDDLTGSYFTYNFIDVEFTKNYFMQSIYDDPSIYVPPLYNAYIVERDENKYLLISFYAYANDDINIANSEQPVFYISYDVTERSLFDNADNGDNLLHYMRNESIQGFTLESTDIVNGVLIPYFVTTDYVPLYIVQNYENTGGFYHFYEIRSLSSDLFINFVSSQENPSLDVINLSLRNPLESDNFIEIYFNAKNFLGGSFTAFNEFIKHYSFPKLDFEYEGIDSIFDLFVSFFYYTGSILNYFSKLLTTIFYGFSPFLVR